MALSHLQRAGNQHGRKVFNPLRHLPRRWHHQDQHNIGLDPETLALATPARDNVDALVNYMKDPTSYDGEYNVTCTHAQRELYPHA